MLTIVDYGMGNLNSVAKAFENLRAEIKVSSRARDLETADQIVLPGVGAFAEGMKNLKELQLVEPLRQQVCERGKPFLSLCLGMQLLARDSYELGHHQGLGYRPVVFDGDEVRDRLSKGLGFSKEDRLENLRRISYVCRLVTQLDGVAIAAAISPYEEARDNARKEIGRFVEIYVKCSLDGCIQRDVKGHYQKALRGEMKGFTGIDDPYEEPKAPDLTVETERMSPEESRAYILEGLNHLGYLKPQTK